MVNFVRDHEELYNKTNKQRTKEGLPVGEVCKQRHAVGEGMQDLVRIPKDLL